MPAHPGIVMKDQLQVFRHPHPELEGGAHHPASRGVGVDKQTVGAVRTRPQLLERVVAVPVMVTSTITRSDDPVVVDPQAQIGNQVDEFVVHVEIGVG